MYLVSQLGLGKETVYRRLRGSVSFTLDEAVQVARSLGISIDRLVGIAATKEVGYEFRIDYCSDFSENYNEFICEHGRILDIMANDPSGVYMMAANHLPYCFYLPYRGLMDFRLRRWLYERGQIESFAEDSVFRLSEEYRAGQLDLLDKYRSVENTYMVWDENVFRSLVKELRYFQLLSMLSDKEISEIKDELKNLIDELEKMMIRGKTPEGKNIYFYLSNVIFDTSYSYLEARNLHTSYFHVYAVHTLQSESPEICAIQKKWLQTILRHSTLITQSGEIERTVYLKNQRAIVDTL